MRLIMYVKERPFSVLVTWFLVAAAVPLLSTGVAFAEKPAERPFRIGLEAMQQIQALQEEKALRTKAQRKVDSQLLYAPKIMRRHALLDRVPELRPAVEVAADGTTLVDIKGIVTPSLLVEIDHLEGTVISSYEQYNAIRARMPLEQIEALADHPDIRFIRPAAKAFTNKVNTSEGDAAHNGALARSTFGVDGSGVKIGVLSDSVDHLADVQATGDLPDVTVLEDAPGNMGEGTAMLEIVHDLAPGAELYFATAWTGMAGFAANILALRAAGCHVIVDDITYLLESPFQDDIISQAVNTVTADDALYFSSSGNSGNLNDGRSGVWEGDFRPVTDSSLPGGLGTMTVHDFGSGDTTNAMTTDPPFAITLFWSDELGDSGNDYDLYLLNKRGRRILAASTNIQNGNDDPWEAIDSGPWDDTDNLLVVSRASQAANRFIHLNTNRGRLEHATAGQIKGHHAAADAFGVAAVDARGRVTAFNGTESIETYCSDGPRRVFYEPNGTPITPGDFLSSGGEVRWKPDLSAADGVATATPLFNPFYGTSAAAPHAAGVAGLLLSAKPHLMSEPAAARAALTITALDIEGSGWDRDSGHGIVMADRAISDDLLASPSGGLRSAGREGGPFNPLSKDYTLWNTGSSSISWNASNEESWVDLSPNGGTLPTSENVTITVSINGTANNLARGAHTDTIRFAYNGGPDITRTVTLNVGKAQPGVILLLTKGVAPPDVSLAVSPYPQS